MRNLIKYHEGDLKMDFKTILNGREYGLTIVEIKPGLSIAVFDMLSSKDLAEDASKALLDKMEETDIDLTKVDTVLSAETKGVILAYNIAQSIGCDMVILRKVFHHK